MEKIYIFMDHLESAAYHLEKKVMGKYAIGWSFKLLLGFEACVFIMMALGLFLLKLPNVLIILIPVSLSSYIGFRYIRRGGEEDDKLIIFKQLNAWVRAAFYFLIFLFPAFCIALVSFLLIHHYLLK